MYLSVCTIIIYYVFISKVRVWLDDYIIESYKLRKVEHLNLLTQEILFWEVKISVSFELQFAIHNSLLKILPYSQVAS